MAVVNANSQPFSVPVSYLPNTTSYYFRIVGYDADNGSLWYGKIVSFKTGKPPVVTTTAATSITGSGATLNGTINPLGANVYWDFQWGTDPTLSTYTDAECNIL